MDAHEAISAARDAAGARQVFGDPVERDGVTVIPAAAVIGGGGGGGSELSDEAGPGGRGGAGLGFGVIARPVGAWEVRDGEVRWSAAVDRTVLVVLGQAVLIVALLVLRGLLRGR
jgi:uncharacterized spore protein YtfJ